MELALRVPSVQVRLTSIVRPSSKARAIGRPAICHPNEAASNKQPNAELMPTWGTVVPVKTADEGARFAERDGADFHQLAPGEGSAIGQQKGDRHPEQLQLGNTVQLLEPKPVAPMDPGEALVHFPAQGQLQEVRERRARRLDVVQFLHGMPLTLDHEAGHAAQPAQALLVEVGENAHARHT